MLIRFSVFIFVAAFFLLQGCVAVQTFPTVARAGDTITLAVGSPDGMTKTNTTVQFVSGATTLNLPIRSIIRLRPDNTSYTGAFDFMTGLIHWSSAHGPWLSIMVIDLPGNLPTGGAVLNVSTSAAYDVGASVNNVPIALEILSGSGTANAFNYNPYGWGVTNGDLADLEPLPQAVIRPKKAGMNDNVVPVGAVEIKVVVPTINVSGGQVPSTDLKVIADELNYYNSSQVQMNWSRNGDEYTVHFMSPSGSLPYFQTRFSVLLSGNPNYQFAQNMPPNIVSVRYFDINGNAVTSGQPTSSQYSVSIE